MNDLYPPEIDNDELNALLTTIKNQGDELEVKDKEIDKLKNLIGRLEKEIASDEEETEATAPKKSTSKSASSKKNSRTTKSSSAKQPKS